MAAYFGMVTSSLRPVGMTGFTDRTNGGP